MNPRDKSRSVARTEEVSVISSNEESPRRETEVDAEEERRAYFGPEKNEDMDLEAEPPLHRPVPTERPLDIFARTEGDG
jgi:hypothetical protein